MALEPEKQEGKTRTPPESEAAGEGPKKPVINPAAAETLMKHIGKPFQVREAVMAVQMEADFQIDGYNFTKGSHIVRLKIPGTGQIKFVGMIDETFKEVYRPARKPRKP